MWQRNEDTDTEQVDGHTNKNTDRHKHTRAEMLKMFNGEAEMHSRGLEGAEAGQSDTQDTFKSTLSG